MFSLYSLNCRVKIICRIFGFWTGCEHFQENQLDKLLVWICVVRARSLPRSLTLISMWCTFWNTHTSIHNEQTTDAINYRKNIVKTRQYKLVVRRGNMNISVIGPFIHRTLESNYSFFLNVFSVYMCDGKEHHNYY